MCTRPLLSQHQTPVSTTSYTYVSRKRAWRRARDKASRDDATPNKRYTGFAHVSHRHRQHQYRRDVGNGSQLILGADLCNLLHKGQPCGCGVATQLEIRQRVRLGTVQLLAGSWLHERAPMLHWGVGHCVEGGHARPRTIAPLVLTTSMAVTV